VESVGKLAEEMVDASKVNGCGTRQSGLFRSKSLQAKVSRRGVQWKCVQEEG